MEKPPRTKELLFLMVYNTTLQDDVKIDERNAQREFQELVLLEAFLSLISALVLVVDPLDYKWRGSYHG